MYDFIVRIMYNILYYNRGLDFCAAIVQLHRKYYLYYIVLHLSSDFCAAYLDYSAALTQKLRALAAPTKLVVATASRCPPPLKIQLWSSC